MIREVTTRGIELVDKIPFATATLRHVIPGSIWRYLSGNDIVNCNKATRPDLRDEGKSPAGVGTSSRRCHSLESLVKGQRGGVGHVGTIDGGIWTCCSTDCRLQQAISRQ